MLSQWELGPAPTLEKADMKKRFAGKIIRMEPTNEKLFGKVPEVTFIFWLIKIAATTLGETGGDAVSMSMNLGYLLSTTCRDG